MAQKSFPSQWLVEKAKREYPAVRNKPHESHGHWKVFSIENWIGRKYPLQPISKCYHRIIQVGTGIPELTIDQLTNQKVPKYHRHVTDVRLRMKNDK